MWKDFIFSLAGGFLLALVAGVALMTPVNYLVLKACFCGLALVFLFPITKALVSWKGMAGWGKIILWFLIVALVSYPLAKSLNWVGGKHQFEIEREKIAAGKEKAEAHEKATKVYSGQLSPRRQSILSVEKGIYPRVQIGDSEVVGEPSKLLSFLRTLIDNDDISIDVENEQIKLSMKIHDQSGKVIAEIVDNEWHVSPPPNTWDRNFNNNTLEVKDPFGDVVLQVRLLEDRIQLQAKLYNSDGNRVVFGKIDGGMKMEIAFDPNYNLTVKIDPIFRYPSDLHLGELIKDD